MRILYTSIFLAAHTAIELFLAASGLVEPWGTNWTALDRGSRGRPGHRRLYRSRGVVCLGPNFFFFLETTTSVCPSWRVKPGRG